jgi:hypothetical protein
MNLVTRYQAPYINRPYCSVSVVFCVCTDWRSIDEPPPKKQKKNGADNEARREEYYQQLKESVGSNSVNTSVDKAEPSIHKYQQLVTKEEVVRQMMDVFSVIKVNERKVIEYYAMLGCVLTQLKFLNITTKCDDCQLQDDINVVLKCAYCKDGKKILQVRFTDSWRIKLNTRGILRTFLLALASYIYNIQNLPHVT